MEFYSRNQQKKINIKELDVDLIHPNPRTLLDPDQGGTKIITIGKPGTGKSNISKSILYEKSHMFPIGQFHSGSERINKFYEKFCPETFIFDELNINSFHNLTERQVLAVNFFKAGKMKNPWAACIWDDLGDVGPKLFNDPVVKGFYKNGRHFKIFQMFNIQYALDIEPTIRQSIDGSFIMRENRPNIRKTLYNNYASGQLDIGDFNDILDKLPEYTALYIDNQNQSTNIEDVIFWYTRKDIPKDWKFGCDEIWNWHNEKFDDKAVKKLSILG